MIEPAVIQVRFADLDTLGHVNNSVYLTYFEVARVHYFGKLLGKNWDWNENGLILVKNEVEYLQPILLHDQPEIFMYTVSIGNKSFVLEYEVHVNKKLHARGNSTLVSFDSRQNKTILIPPTMKEALNKLKREQ